MYMWVAWELDDGVRSWWDSSFSFGIGAQMEHHNAQPRPLACSLVPSPRSLARPAPTAHLLSPACLPGRRPPPTCSAPPPLRLPGEAAPLLASSVLYLLALVHWTSYLLQPLAKTNLCKLAPIGPTKLTARHHGKELPVTFMNTFQL
jgi:hypothetical protein